jgi:hypothetical protein
MVACFWHCWTYKMNSCCTRFGKPCSDVTLLAVAACSACHWLPWCGLVGRLQWHAVNHQWVCWLELYQPGVRIAAMQLHVANIAADPVQRVHELHFATVTLSHVIIPAMSGLSHCMSGFQGLQLCCDACGSTCFAYLCAEQMLAYHSTSHTGHQDMRLHAGVFSLFLI